MPFWKILTVIAVLVGGSYVWDMQHSNEVMQEITVEQPR